MQNYGIELGDDVRAKLLDAAAKVTSKHETHSVSLGHPDGYLLQARTVANFISAYLNLLDTVAQEMNIEPPPVWRVSKVRFRRNSLVVTLCRHSHRWKRYKIIVLQHGVLVREIVPVYRWLGQIHAWCLRSPRYGIDAIVCDEVPKMYK